MMKLRFPGGVPKALTLSYDDGVEQDRRLIGILDRYGIHATFNLNSGCWAPEGHRWPEGQIHRRLPLSEARALYANPNHEVAVHCLTHASLTDIPADQVVHEIMADRENLEATFGGIIRGAAYPFGTYNAKVAELLHSCGIRFCRTVASTHRFDLMDDWCILHPTCHHDDPMLGELEDRFLADKGTFGPKLFYLWGHAYEFEANNNWERIEQFCEKMSGRSDTWYATNIQIVDYVEAWRALRFSANGRTIYNPTDIAVTFEDDRAGMKTIQPGTYLSLD